MGLFGGTLNAKIIANVPQTFPQSLGQFLSTRAITCFQSGLHTGYKNEDINRWFEKLELVLESKRIRLDVPATRTQLINNLAGPAETFMFELPPEERGDFDTLKQALLKHYSMKDCAWVKRQHLVACRQGTNELLSDYINDMHELFSGLNMAEVDKVTYFTEGLTQ